MNTRELQLMFIDNRDIPGGPIAYELTQYSSPVLATTNCIAIIAGWLADGFLLYRCMVIFHLKFYIVTLPILLYLGSISMGILFLFQASRPGASLFNRLSINFGIPYFSLSASLNVVIAILITSRLLLFRRTLHRALGSAQASSIPYISIAAMVVESSLLYAITSLLFVIPYGANSHVSNLFLPVLSQAPVIASMLIILRVAKRRAWDARTMTTPMSTGMKVEGLAFAQGTTDSNYPTGDRELGEIQLHLRPQGSFSAANGTPSSMSDPHTQIMSTPRVVEGTIPFEVGDETFHTWYKLVGDLTSAKRPPLVVLHGGPGSSHDYMLPLTDLANRSPPLPIIFYDQIGSARSTHLPSKPAEFWTIDLFVSELENLIAYFNISESFDLIGQSWGSQLAAEFIARKQPTGLRRLILANGLASASLRNEARSKLMLTLPEDVQETIKRHDKEGTTLAPEYKAAWHVFYAKYACRMDPLPHEVVYTLEQMDDDEGGAVVLDNMRKNILEYDWDVTDRIHLIRVPTLIINGEYDYMTDEVCAPFFWKIDRVKWVKFALSSHMPQWEERERYMEVVDGFLGQA
ncbi:hypothetical protein EW146_g152 [Bondarzewia mesenterica]|uniref:AB hydrolase-1 domain-containing protein n=1 Tax=Bondarzewia mesenterica TaxID=1095465 RepID=A0A4S4M7W7_9AGAM|nr:hypothetical protein EW146_g152 [Bondarzewia mesenterica]